MWNLYILTRGKDSTGQSTWWGIHFFVSSDCYRWRKRCVWFRVGKLEQDYNKCLLPKYGEDAGGIMIWGWNLGLLLALMSFRDNLLPHIFYVITTWPITKEPISRSSGTPSSMNQKKVWKRVSWNQICPIPLLIDLLQKIFLTKKWQTEDN